ncbi:MAG: hypothetical protein ACR2LG_10000 [Actinomycetota bacterium]
MRRARQIYDEVREAQALLGIGQIDEAMALAEPLRREAMELLGRSSLTSFERLHAGGAAVYATVTLILGAAESSPPAESVPRIRALATATVAAHLPKADARTKADVRTKADARTKAETWKVLAAAAEMLARAGDAGGASWAAKKALELGPDEEYLTRVAGGIRSMYPQVYAATPHQTDAPPPLPGTG